MTAVASSDGLQNRSFPVLHLYLTAAYLYVLFRFVLPLPLSMAVRIGIAVGLLLVSKYHLLSLLIYGNMFSPELPIPVVLLLGWLFCAFVLLTVFVVLVDLVHVVQYITGVGLSNFIPILFSAAGRLSRNAAVPTSQGLAVTTRMAYVGLLIGPLVIGPIAQQIRLRYAVVILALGVGATCLGWLWISHASGGTPWQLRPSATASHYDAH